MTKLTKEEQIQAIYDLKVGYTLGHADIAMLKSMARQLLASMVQELVYQVLGDGSWTDYSKQQLEDLLYSKPSTLFRVAYVAPQLPQPAVPECYQRLLKHAYGMTMGHDWNKGTMAGYHREKLCKAVEDCRAAMLQGDDGNSPVIPDGWVMVPKEATAEMINSAMRDNETCGLDEIYELMIAEAPQQEVKL